MSTAPRGGDGSAALSALYSGHEECRLREFVRWPRIMMEHERDYLSRLMRGKAFLKPGDTEAILHELADLDWCLSQLPKRIATDGR